eukprot:scaffold4869_cov123-Isochrysis_galbana.AAC.8
MFTSTASPQPGDSASACDGRMARRCPVSHFFFFSPSTSPAGWISSMARSRCSRMRTRRRRTLGARSNSCLPCGRRARLGWGRDESRASGGKGRRGQVWRWCPCHSDGASRSARGSFLVRVHDEAWGHARCLAHESGETGQHAAYAPLQPLTVAPKPAPPSDHWRERTDPLRSSPAASPSQCTTSSEPFVWPGTRPTAAGQAGPLPPLQATDRRERAARARAAHLAPAVARPAGRAPFGPD